MKIDYLYRGVSLEQHKLKTGLNPKNNTFSREVQLGQEYAQLGSGISLGKSRNNAIIGHQYNSSLYPTSGVSTSIDLEIAKKYATNRGSRSGFIYKIDFSLLKPCDIEAFVVSECIPFPKLPEDKEVILHHIHDQNIPLEIVIEQIKVEP